jgi:hypothetical protein
MNIQVMGSMDDPYGTKNNEWEKLIPENPDGTVPLALSGFVSTSKGTQCKTCVFFVKNHCLKIQGKPRVQEYNCCNYWKSNKELYEKL